MSFCIDLIECKEELVERLRSRGLSLGLKNLYGLGRIRIVRVEGRSEVDEFRSILEKCLVRRDGQWFLGFRTKDFDLVAKYVHAGDCLLFVNSNEASGCHDFEDLFRRNCGGGDHVELEIWLVFQPEKALELAGIEVGGIENEQRNLLDDADKWLSELLCSLYPFRDQIQQLSKFVPPISRFGNQSKLQEPICRFHRMRKSLESTAIRNSTKNTLIEFDQTNSFCRLESEWLTICGRLISFVFGVSKVNLSKRLDSKEGSVYRISIGGISSVGSLDLSMIRRCLADRLSENCDLSATSDGAIYEAQHFLSTIWRLRPRDLPSISGVYDLTDLIDPSKDDYN